MTPEQLRETARALIEFAMDDNPLLSPKGNLLRREGADRLARRLELYANALEAAARVAPDADANGHGHTDAARTLALLACHRMIHGPVGAARDFAILALRCTDIRRQYDLTALRDAQTPPQDAPSKIENLCRLCGALFPTRALADICCGGVSHWNRVDDGEAVGYELGIQDPITGLWTLYRVDYGESSVWSVYREQAVAVMVCQSRNRTEARKR